MKGISGAQCLIKMAEITANLMKETNAGIHSIIAVISLTSRGLSMMKNINRHYFVAFQEATEKSESLTKK